MASNPGTNQLDMAANTAKGSFSELVVYAKSSLAEQTMPGAALSLTDTVSSVSKQGSRLVRERFFISSLNPPLRLSIWS